MVIAALALTACRQASTTSAPASPASVVGIAKVGPGNPAVAGRVRLLDARGTAIAGASAAVGSRGHFAILVDRGLLPGDYQVVVEGGSHSGGVVVDQMRADVRIAEKEHGPAYVTPLSTVAAEWMSRHPGASLAASRIAAKKALGIPEWAHHVNAAIWTEKYVSSSALLAAVAKAGGFAAWSRDVVDTYERGGTTPYPPALTSTRRDIPRAASVGAKGAGGFAATVAWTVVAGQAASCDPGSSDIPGLGWLGAMLNSSGMIQTNPACADGISSQLARIEEQLDIISYQVSTLGEMVDEVLKKLNQGSLLTGLSTYEPYRNAIRTHHDEEVLLETKLAAVAYSCGTSTGGVTTDATITTLAGSVDGNGKPTTADYTCSDGAKASTHWGSLRATAAANMQNMTSDTNWVNAPSGLQAAIQGLAGVSTSLPYLYWQWVANLPAVPLVTRAQIESYVDFVYALGGATVARGLQEVSKVRQTDYSNGIYDGSALLRTDVASDLDIVFGFYANGTVLDAIVPVAQLPASLGYQLYCDPNFGPCPQGIMWGALSTAPPTGPLLDITSGKAWVSACLDGPPAPDLPPLPGQTLDIGTPDDCPTRGIIAWLPDAVDGYGSQWFMKRAPRNYGCPDGFYCGVWPSTDTFDGWDSTAWKRNPSGAAAVDSIFWQRPIVADLQTLVAIAQNNAQQGSSIASWLKAHGGGVLDGVDERSVATSILMINCVPDVMNYLPDFACWRTGTCGWDCSVGSLPNSQATAFVNLQNLSNLDASSAQMGTGYWGGASNMEGWENACPNHGGVAFYQWQLPASFGGAGFLGLGSRSLDQARVELGTSPDNGVWSWTFGSGRFGSDTCGQGTFGGDGLFNPYDLNPFRSVALLVGDVPDIGSYVPFYGQ